MNDLPSKKSCRVGNLSVSRVSVWLARIITSLRTCYSQREVIQDVEAKHSRSCSGFVTNSSTIV